MSRIERVAALILFAAAFTLGAVKTIQFYHWKTMIVPANGGEFNEVLVGDVKYLNPILVSTDAEKSISSLLFRGLIQINSADTVEPDLADHWEISPDNKTYTFFLKPDQHFSDGSIITANDVSFTVDSIKDPATKSSLETTWSDVSTEVVDDNTISFTLPQAYGPFLNNCNFGIVPSSISSDEFAKKLTGSGPFSFVKSVQSNNKITKVELARNERYDGKKAYISKVSFNLSSNKEDALTQYESNEKINGIFGAAGEGQKRDFNSSRRLGLIFNLRKELLADKEFRRQIIDGSRFNDPRKISLTTLDLPLQQQKADEIKSKLAAQNIEVEVKLLPPVKFQDALQNRDYELLLYGFDFGYDRDPYALWHSSQLDLKNYAGWSDKNSDILLEDARMLLETDKRNAKYDQFFETLRTQYLAIFYDPVSFNFSLKDEIKGVKEITGTQPSSRFSDIVNWYIKEKRVGKN